MTFYNRLALGWVIVGALAFAGCQEDNEKAVKAQANLSAPADAKGAAPAPQPKSLEDMAKQAKSAPSTPVPSNYPGASRYPSTPAGKSAQ